MKFKVIVGIVAMTVLFHDVSALTVDTVVCAQVCAGNNISCKANVLNCGRQTEGGSSWGDLLNSATDINERFYSWGNLKNVRTENLGLVNGEKNFSTQFPAAGQKKIVKFTATSGELAGKMVSLLFVSFDLNATRYQSGTPKELQDAMTAFKKENKTNEIKFASSVHIFGRIENENPKWFHAGPINLGIMPDTPGFDISMKVMADGRITIIDSKLLEQTGVDGATAHIAPIELDFSKIPEMLGQ